MSFFLLAADIDAARAVGLRAIRTISFREEDVRLKTQALIFSSSKISIGEVQCLGGDDQFRTQVWNRSNLTRSLQASGHRKQGPDQSSFVPHSFSSPQIEQVHSLAIGGVVCDKW